MCVVQGCFRTETRVVGQRGIVLIFEHFKERAKLRTASPQRNID